MSEVLELAKEMGYKEDFEGDGKKTPEEFIKHSSTIIKNQSGKLKDVLGKIEGMSSVITDMQKTFNSTIETNRAQHKAELEKQKRDLETKLDTAVDEADRGEVKRIREELKEIDKKSEAPKAEEINVDQAYFNKWRSDKTWIDSDKKAQAAFRIAQIEVRTEKGDNISAEVELTEIDKILKDKYPEKYGLKAKEEPPAGYVGSGEGKNSIATKVLKMTDLTVDEKSFVDRLKRLQGNKFNEAVTLTSVKNTRDAASKRRA